MNKTQITIIIVLLIIAVTGSFYLMVWEKLKENNIIVDEAATEEKDGQIKQYTSNGKLRTIVTYEKGVKHGMSYMYHKDGTTVLLAMPYNSGKREGTSKKYYTSGKIYAETDYQNDLLHGNRKVYYSSGKLKSQVPYFEGFPGTGTIEYLKNGTQKTMPSITYETKGNVLLLSVSGACQDATFFIGKLINDQYLDYLHDDITRLPESNGIAFIDLNVYTPSYLRYQDIVCSCTSSQSNPVIIKKKITP